MNQAVGLVGWRGMVGSVLMQRMQEENDFALGFEPVFFTTSQAGQPAPMGAGTLKKADDIEELKKLGREDIIVIAGGVIPAQDYDYLYKAGVAAIFGPGSPVAKAACTIMEILLEE